MKAVAVLERYKGIVKHRGILLDSGRVLHNTPDNGEHISSYAEYAQGKPVIQKVIPKYLQSASASRILMVIINPRRYSSLTNNCQHTANEVIFGTRHSEYVSIGILAFTALFLFYSMKARR